MSSLGQKKDPNPSLMLPSGVISIFGRGTINSAQGGKDKEGGRKQKKYPKLCSFGVFRGVVQQFSICTSTRPFLCFLCLTQLFSWLDGEKTLIL